MNDCVFCKIVAGEIPAQKIWEDGNYLAFLDIDPLREGQTLVAPKKHLGSYVFNLSDEEVCGLYLASKKVANLLDKSLGVERTCQVMEGLGVNHAHIKLYPTSRGGTEGELVGVGPKADMEDLEKLAIRIREGGMK